MTLDGEIISGVLGQPARLLVERRLRGRTQFAEIAVEENAVADIDCEILRAAGGCGAGSSALWSVLFGAAAIASVARTAAAIFGAAKKTPPFSFGCPRYPRCPDLNLRRTCASVRAGRAALSVKRRFRQPRRDLATKLPTLRISPKASADGQRRASTGRLLLELARAYDNSGQTRPGRNA